MKNLMILGLFIQLLGAWFLCRVFFKAFDLKLGQTVPWMTRFTNKKWEKHWSKLGNVILWVKGLPWEERMEQIELVADPNATFAFVLIALGAALQVFGTLVG